jgi:chromosomal replication initiator protein
MAEIASTRSIASIATPAQKPEVPALPALAGQLPATPGRILVRRVIKATAEHFGTTPDDLVSAGRTKPLTRRRQVAMYVARKMTGRSLFFIGRKIGDRHHTTVLHGVRAVRGLLDAGDAEMVAAVGAIMERLQSDGRQPGTLFRVLTGRH